MAAFGTLYGRPGFGSAIVETLAALAGLELEFVQADPMTAEGRAILQPLNPMAQTPTLKLADGSVMTESVAIALLIACRTGRLEPPADSPDWAQHLRWLVFVANIYATFWYADDPSRVLKDSAAQGELKEALNEHRKRLWRILEGEARGGTGFFPSGRTALDAFIAVMTHWSPRRPWFAAECPRLTRIAEAVAAEPAAAPVLARNFPNSASS
jgi:GST-like protein